MQDTAHTQLPLPREWLEAAEAEEETVLAFSDSDLRAGQRAVGEALWLAMKSRPDILYVVNSMAANVARKPLQVARMGQRLLSYLKGTSDLELILAPACEGEPKELTCYTDASFAPFGGRSFGATVVVCGKAAIAWKAGKQSFVTMSTMEAELYAAAQGFNLLESLFAVVDEIEPGVYSRVLAIDNSSAVAMCQGGHGSQRTRHLKVRAQYIRAVRSGRLKVKHTPGEVQLADLATKMVTQERLWELLGLWGCIGGKVARAWDKLKIKMLIFAMMVVSMVMPAAGSSTTRAEKEAIQISGFDELLLVTTLVCVAAIAIWQFGKLATKWCWRQYKGTKRARRLDNVRRLAAEAAVREVQSAGQGDVNSDEDVPTTSMASTSTRAKARSRPSVTRTTRAPSTPSPREVQEQHLWSPGSSEAYNPRGEYPTRSVNDFTDRPRVVRDTLSLLTVEALQQALRRTGHPVTGLKQDLTARLSPELDLRQPGPGSMQPSTKQLKYVLWLWREKDLSGRVALRWEDISTRSAISSWIAAHK